MIIYAADTKVSELSMISVPDSNDLVYMVDDPCGTPASVAIPWKDFFTGYTGAEVDPCWVDWLAGPPNVSEFTNDAGYLTSYSETDPCHVLHLSTYDHNDIADGETAYGWGDHSLAGYGDMTKAIYDVLEDGFVDGNDTAYGASWNGNVNAVSMNAVYDKIQTLGGGGDMTKAVYDVLEDDFVDGNDTPYAVSWNGNINAPSMNAVYDQLETISNPWTISDSNIYYNSGFVGIGTETPDNTLQVVGDAAIGDDGTNYTLIGSTGNMSFAGTASLAIPNSNNPTTDAVGEIAWDANDFGLEVYDGSASRLIPSTRFFSATIIQPADVQSNIDAVPLLPVESYWAPFGIKLLRLGIKTNSSSTYSIDFEEWTAPNDGSPSAIETVATSSSYEAIDNGTLTDSDIAAGSIIYADLPTTDVNSVQIWGTYYIKTGD